MKNKSKNILLGAVIGVLAVGVVASIGSALNEENGWWDNLKADIEEKLNEDVAAKNILDVNNLKAGVYSKDIKTGNFTIHATDEKSVEILEQDIFYTDESNETYEFTQRLRFGGAGSLDYRSIEFNITETSDVNFYFRSPTSGSARTFNIYELVDGEIGESIATHTSSSDQTVTFATEELEEGTYVVYGSAALDFYRVEINSIEDTETVTSEA